jgi:uncharacterized protein (TIGR02266 family)
MIETKLESDLPAAAADASNSPPRAENNRDSLRHAVQLRVDYKRMNTFFADYAKNISKGGTFIRTSKPLDVGTEFVFVLSIPEPVNQLELRGEVMWTVVGEAGHRRAACRNGHPFSIRGRRRAPDSRAFRRASSWQRSSAAASRRSSWAGRRSRREVDRSLYGQVGGRDARFHSWLLPERIPLSTWKTR